MNDETLILRYEFEVPLSELIDFLNHSSKYGKLIRVKIERENNIDQRGYIKVKSVQQINKRLILEDKVLRKLQMGCFSTKQLWTCLKNNSEHCYKTFHRMLIRMAIEEKITCERKGNKNIWSIK